MECKNPGQLGGTQAVASLSPDRQWYPEPPQAPGDRGPGGQPDFLPDEKPAIFHPTGSPS